MLTNVFAWDDGWFGCGRHVPFFCFFKMGVCFACLWMVMIGGELFVACIWKAFIGGFPLLLWIVQVFDECSFGVDLFLFVPV